MPLHTDIFTSFNKHYTSPGFTIFLQEFSGLHISPFILLFSVKDILTKHINYLLALLSCHLYITPNHSLHFLCEKELHYFYTLILIFILLLASYNPTFTVNHSSSQPGIQHWVKICTFTPATHISLMSP